MSGQKNKMAENSTLDLLQNLDYKEIEKEIIIL